MTTFYADSGSGIDGHAGRSWGTATKTIKAALVSASVDGDIVIVSASQVYFESGLSAANHNVQLKSKPGEMAVIDGIGATNSCFAMGSYSGTYYENLEIRNYDQASTRIWDNDTGTGNRKFSLSGCYVHDNNATITFRIEGNSGSQLGKYDGASDHALVGECIFLRTGQRDAANGSAIMVDDTHVLFRNTLFIGANPPNGVFILQGQDYENTTASFCTAIATGSTFSIGGGGSKNAIQIGRAVNCIVSGGTTGVEKWNGIKAIQHSHNCVYVDGEAFQDADGDEETAGTGDITSDPQFADPSSLDFSLQSTSPCVSTALEIVGISTDLSGTKRPMIKWGPLTTPASPKFTATSFTLNLYNNASAQRQKVASVNDMGAYVYKDPNELLYSHAPVEQVPFSTAVLGPAFLRGRTTAYCVSSKGGNPLNIISGSSN